MPTCLLTSSLSIACTIITQNKEYTHHCSCRWFSHQAGCREHIISILLHTIPSCWLQFYPLSVPTPAPFRGSYCRWRSDFHYIGSQEDAEPLLEWDLWIVSHTLHCLSSVLPVLLFTDRTLSLFNHPASSFLSLTLAISAVDGNALIYNHLISNRTVKDSSVICVQIFDQKKFKKKDQGFLGVINVKVSQVIDLDLGGEGKSHHIYASFTHARMQCSALTPTCWKNCRNTH